MITAMKKTYIQPTIQIVHVESAQIIATSSYEVGISRSVEAADASESLVKSYNNSIQWDGFDEW